MENIFKNIYNYRELLKTNVKKEIRGRYKQSFLGVIWSFLNPLLQLLVYSIIFPIILKNEIDNYVIFLCVGLIPWTFFTTIITQSTGVVIANGNIIKKVYFPREILPISVVTSAAINFVISTLIIIVFVLCYGMGITWHIVFYPVILLVQYLLSIGISFFVSSLTVYLRDLEHLISVAMMMLFYATPIVYSMQTMEGVYKAILMLNPMAHLIEGYRAIFYYQTIPDFKWIGIIFILAVILCITGYMVFKKLEKRFAEEL